MKNKLMILCLLTLAVISTLSIFDMKKITIKKSAERRMYESIMYYADSLNIPLYFAFNIATIETGYRGPFDTTYNHAQVSKAGALGPMQIVYKYSHYYAGRKVSRSELRDSIEFNVRLSMIILKEHYSKYKDWAKVAGAYNTGKPVINSYARKAIDSTYYQKKWILDN